MRLKESRIIHKQLSTHLKLFILFNTSKEDSQSNTCSRISVAHNLYSLLTEVSHFRTHFRPHTPLMCVADLLLKICEEIFFLYKPIDSSTVDWDSNYYKNPYSSQVLTIFTAEKKHLNS